MTCNRLSKGMKETTEVQGERIASFFALTSFWLPPRLRRGRIANQWPNPYLANKPTKHKMEAKSFDQGEVRAWTHWFEIPVSDMDRAARFYSALFDCHLHRMDFGEFQMAIFPHGVVGAALCAGPWYHPGTSGPVVYLNANPDLQATLDKVEAAGGSVVMPKKQISPEHGHMALFIDSEGNRLALHSNG